MTRAFRNIPGVELCSVDRLGLLSLAPGSLGQIYHLDEEPFEKLDGVFGTKAQASSSKKGWKPPAHIMTHQI